MYTSTIPEQISLRCQKNKSHLSALILWWSLTFRGNICTLSSSCLILLGHWGKGAGRAVPSLSWVQSFCAHTRRAERIQWRESGSAESPITPKFVVSNDDRGESSKRSQKGQVRARGARTRHGHTCVVTQVKAWGRGWSGTGSWARGLRVPEWAPDEGPFSALHRALCTALCPLAVLSQHWPPQPQLNPQEARKPSAELLDAPGAVTDNGVVCSETTWIYPRYVLLC